MEIKLGKKLGWRKRLLGEEVSVCVPGRQNKCPMVSVSYDFLVKRVKLNCTRSRKPGKFQSSFKLPHDANGSPTLKREPAWVMSSHHWDVITKPK
jgi:hypothetical protein